MQIHANRSPRLRFPPQTPLFYENQSNYQKVKTNQLRIHIRSTAFKQIEPLKLLIGFVSGWVDFASWRQEERDTHQRQPKQGGDDCYQQLHPRAVVSFHRRLKLEQNEHVVFLKNKISQNFTKFLVVE